MRKITDQPYNIAYDHRPIVREIRLNRAYELFRQANENKTFSRQSGVWHDETAMGLDLIDLAN
jgi:hypothetical protein